jgi:uncharacterized membrane protein YhiD involved in acid resistance
MPGSPGIVSFSPMLQEFQSVAFRSITFGQVATSLAVALVCGLAISTLYRWTYRGTSYSPGFVRSMLFMAMITAIVMLAIGNNLARAFGLVGAMSIIRFRTAVKDPQDIVFIFFALAAGLAAGVGMHMVAIVGTIMIGLIVLITTKSNYGVLNKQSFLLQMTYGAPGQNGDASYLPVMKKYCKRHNLVNARSGIGDALNLTFYVRLRNDDMAEAFTRELGQSHHVSNVNLFFDEEQG